MTDRTKLGDVAILIDYENLVISLKRHFGVPTPRMSLLIQEAQERGRLVLARAYAPWTSPDLAIDAENLYRQGIDLVYVPTGKNSADVRMAVDAVETSSRAANISTFVIVTGDGDLIHPLNFLRQAGKTVIVIGVDAAMSRMLSAAADAVLLYERDLDPSVRRVEQPRANRRQAQPARAERQASPRLSPTAGHPPADEAFAMVRDALTRRGGGEPVLYQELGHWLSEDFSLRPRTWYSVPFSTFMDAAAEAGAVTINTSGGNSYAMLPQTAANDTSNDESDEEEDSGDGQAVRLESLRDDEREALFAALRDLTAARRDSRLTFRTILRTLVDNSVLPRLSQRQIRRLLNDLERRDPPVLVRSQKRSRDSNGATHSVTIYSFEEGAAP
jgi:uncharacterized protein (TIGR00288 family)